VDVAGPGEKFAGGGSVFADQARLDEEFLAGGALDGDGGEAASGDALGSGDGSLHLGDAGVETARSGFEHSRQALPAEVVAALVAPGGKGPVELHGGAHLARGRLEFDHGEKTRLGAPGSGSAEVLPGAGGLLLDLDPTAVLTVAALDTVGRRHGDAIDKPINAGEPREGIIVGRVGR